MPQDIQRAVPEASPMMERQLRRQITRLEGQTVIRMAHARSEAVVSHEKMREVDHLAREAMTGQALLSQWAATISNGDAVLSDELHFFVGLARMGKGQIIADLVDDYCRERG